MKKIIHFFDSLLSILSFTFLISMTNQGNNFSVSSETISNSWTFVYDQYLKDNCLNNDDVRFSLAYINDDDIPELLVAHGDAHPYGIGIISYKNDSLIEYKNPFGGDFGEFGTMYYYEKKNIINSRYNGMGDNCDYIYSLGSDSSTLNCSFTRHYNSDTENFTYYINDNTVDKDIYDIKLRPYNIIYNKNTIKTVSYSKNMVDVTDYNIKELIYHYTDTVIAEGICGDNVTWKFISVAPEIKSFDDDENIYVWSKAKLVISGTGDMYDYTNGENTPWDIAIGEYMEAQALKEGISYDIPEAIDTDIIIEDGITHLGSYSFYNNAWISPMSVKLPNTLKSIGKRVFSAVSYNGAYLEEVNIPASVENIDPTAFSCSVERFNVDKNNAYYTSVDGVLFTKDMKTLVIYPSMKSLYCYRVPDSVTKIYSSTFSAYETGGCLHQHPDTNSRITVSFPHDIEVERINYRYSDDIYKYEYPFQSIINTQDSWSYYGGVTVYVPSNDSSIADFIREIPNDWNNDIEIIENNVIITGTCGDTITWKEYEDGTLIIEGTGDILEENLKDSDGNSISFAYAEIGNATTSTGEYGKDISYVVIGEGITSIGNNLFCASWIHSISLPSTLQKIGKNIVRNNHMESFYIPATLTEIDNNIFADKNSFKEFIVDDDNPNYKSVDGVLYNKDMTELIAYPGCKSLDGFVVPSTVKTIKSGAFDVNLGSLNPDLNKDVIITIPSTVTSIEIDGAYPFCSISEAYSPAGCYNSFTVIGQKGSEAEKFVNAINAYTGLNEINLYNQSTYPYQNYVDFETIETPMLNIKYDINNDNLVNYLDILTLKKSLLGISQSVDYLADLNNDNKINVLDLIEIKKYIF